MKVRRREWIGHLLRITQRKVKVFGRFIGS